MTDKAISPLRQRLIDDMAIRRLDPSRLSTNISATSKALRISLADLLTGPRRKMFIAISCGWRRSERRSRP
jgi:hypothetical protein